MKNHVYIIRLTYAALFAAIIMLATFFISIPNGVGGYIHPGDSVIYTCAWFMGGPIAAAAAAVGSALADLLAGYPQFALATFIIKGIMGLVVGVAMKKMPNKIAYRTLAMLFGAIIMMVGYFAVVVLLYGLVAAYTELLFNLIQAAVGILLGTVLIEAFRKVNGINSFREKLRG